MNDKIIDLNATPRTITGKKVKQLRANGIIPAVIYGYKTTNENITITRSDLIKTYRKVGKGRVLNLKLGTKNISVIIQDFILHPLNEDFLHVDFLAVNIKAVITAEIPIIFIGESPAIKNAGGVLFTQLHNIELSALPSDLPEKVTVDLSILEEIGQSVHTADINLPKDVTLAMAEDIAIVSIQSSRMATENEAADEVEAAASTEEVVENTANVGETTKDDKDKAAE